MATIKLVPSTYSVSNTTVTVSNPDNMYTDTSSTNYATITHTTSGTTSYYLYLKGFNFNDVPDDATVSSIVIRIRGYESGLATSTSYAPRLYNNTSTITGASAASSNFGTTTNTITVPYTGTWATLKGYGANLGIRLTVRRNQRNTQCYIYVYGAEIEVTYTVPVSRTITTTLTGDGTIEPSGSNTYYDGDTFDLIIEPSNPISAVTATKNGTDITSSLVKHSSGEESAVLGAYSLKSGSFNGSGATYFQGLVGKGHTASGTTSNYYSSSSGTQAVFQYKIDLDVPSNATITRLYMMATGHAESTSQSSEYMCVQLKSGNTNLSSQYNFKSAGTSNTTQTIEATTIPTHEQLENLVVECTLGYYGGALSGVTVYCEFTANPYYTYSYEVDGDATIAVIIGEVQQTIYYKNNGSWVPANAVYKKVNGSWVLQTNLANVFDNNTNYVKG